MIKGKEKEAGFSVNLDSTSAYNNLYDTSEHGNLEYPVIAAPSINTPASKTDNAMTALDFL